MPDGTGFFSAPPANNRFDVGEWNICKQLTSRRHPAFPQSTRGLYQSPVARPLSAFRQSDNPALILSKNWTLVIAVTERPTELPYSQPSWLRERKPRKSSKGRRLPNLRAVVMTFAAGHRHKSDKYLGAVLRSQNHKQPQPLSSAGEKRG